MKGTRGRCIRRVRRHVALTHLVLVLFPLPAVLLKIVTWPLQNSSGFLPSSMFIQCYTFDPCTKYSSASFVLIFSPPFSFLFSSPSCLLQYVSLSFFLPADLRLRPSDGAVYPNYHIR